MVLRRIRIHKLMSLDVLDRLNYPSDFFFTKRICSNADDRKAILLIISENSSYISYVRYGISCVNAPNNGYNQIMYNSLVISLVVTLVVKIYFMLGVALDDKLILKLGLNLLINKVFVKL